MDPDFYREEAAGFYDEALEKDLEGEEEHWDERFFNELEEDEPEQDIQDIEGLLYPDRLNADQVGLSLAFGEFILDDKKTYDVDENTDTENWENAMELCSLQDRHNSVRSLSEFEKYVNDIASGITKGPWSKDE